MCEGTFSDDFELLSILVVDVICMAFRREPSSHVLLHVSDHGSPTRAMIAIAPGGSRGSANAIKC